MPHNRRAMLILARVALSGSASRRTLAANCWEDVPAETARKNLRSVLSNLRRLVPDLLVIDRDRVALNPDAAESIDALAFVMSADIASDPTRDPVERLEHCERARRMYTGPLLDGADERAGSTLAEWIEDERRHLELRHLDVLATAADLLREQRRLVEATESARALVAAGRFRESSYHALAQLEMDGGDRTAALATIDRARNMLEVDLGVPLGPELSALDAELRADRPAVVAELMKLPVERRLFGRSDLIDDLDELRHAVGPTLITLTGIGGIGKTSLAIALAHRSRRRGVPVVFVELADTDPGEMVADIADALRLDRVDHHDDLRQRLGSRRLHLVLDNLEHLSTEAIPIVQTIVAECPNIDITVTSRLPLGIRDEHVVVVPLLDASESAPIDFASAQAMFRHVAASRGAVMSSTDEAAAAIANVCAWTGGLPLAIELAAGQLRVMSAADLADMVGHDDVSALIDDRFGVPDRHRSLARAIESSLALLDDVGRSVFATTAVFDGPFPRSALLRVAGVGVATSDILRGLAQLCALNLLQRDDDHGETWFVVLPALRGVAAELASSERNTWCARRVDYDVEVIIEGTRHLRDNQAARWGSFIARYEPTVNDTLRRLAAADDHRRAEMLIGLAHFWFDRGRFQYAAKRLAACPLPSSPSLAWVGPARALWESVLRAETVGYATVDGLAESVVDCVEELRQVAAPPEFLRHLLVACHALDLADRSDVAASLLVDGRLEAKRIGDPWSAVQIEYSLAMIAHVDGDPDAVDLLRHSLADAIAHDNRRVELYARMMLTIAGVPAGPDDRGYGLTELLEAAVELGDQRQVIWLLCSLATVALLEGDDEAMAGYALDALTIAEHVGYFLGVCYVIMAAASANTWRGDADLAARFHAVVDGDIDQIERSMPREYFDAYLAVVAEFDARIVDDPELQALRHPTQPPSVADATERAREYFAGLAAVERPISS